MINYSLPTIVIISKLTQERSQVAVVSGGSSGIGLEAFLLLARNEFRTYATVHNLHGAQQLLDIIKKEKENEMPLTIYGERPSTEHYKIFSTYN